MASQSQPRPQLYLITPPLIDETMRDQLAAVLKAAPIACVLITTASSDEAQMKKTLQSLAPLIQQHDTALLTLNAPHIAMRAQADGCHIATQSETLADDLAQAIASIKPRGIIGVGNLKSKHDAMSAGERDIDYVMFGEPSADGYVAPFEQRCERISWWADIFNVPCVAYAHNFDEIKLLCKAGADFIALGSCIWHDLQGPAAAIAHAYSLLEA
jgi:thiamine-phosphate pyrophosphorylase